MIRRWSIARRLFIANLLFILVLTAIVGTAAFVDARDRAYNDAGQRMQAVAAAIAANPSSFRPPPRRIPQRRCSRTRRE